MKLKGIVLVRPKKHANVGGIARSMAAFGFKDLIIVQKPDQLNLKKASHISKQGKKIIENVKLVNSLSEIKGIKIGTISMYDNERFGFKLTELSEMNWPDEFYLVMGSEGDGLTYGELRECDCLITIETEGKYGVLNLGVATAIILREIYCKLKKKEM